MTNSSTNFQNSQFDPDLPRNNTPAIITRLYRASGQDKTIRWELARVLGPIYTALLRPASGETLFDIQIQ